MQPRLVPARPESRLGAAGIITSVDVGTSFFTDDLPDRGLRRRGLSEPESEFNGPSTEWIEIVRRAPLLGTRTTASRSPTLGALHTHVRLSTATR